MTVDFSAVFNMEPEEIVNYFEAKGLKTSFDWHEVYASAHARAFTVAKMTDIELLSDTKKLLERAIKEGKSYSSFKKEALALFDKKGWLDFQEVEDPKTGEMKTVELGTPSRVKKIYDCNMNSAYSIGRYREQLEEADIAPYWQYMSLSDERVRPEHRALHGKVFRYDDPFWQKFYPPNGWGCRCYVRNLTQGQLEREGLKVESTEGYISSVIEEIGGLEREIPTYTFDNLGTPMTLKPDLGFEGNLGADDWWVDVQAWNKVQNLDKGTINNFLNQMALNPYTKEAYEIWAGNILKNGAKNVELEKTLSWITPELYQKLGNEIKSPLIVISDRQIGHSGKNKVIGQALSAKEYLEIYDIVNKPDETYWDYTNPNRKQIAFIRIIKGTDKCIKVCVRFDQKSRYKNREYLISKVTTVGKVPYIDMAKGNKYKKME